MKKEVNNIGENRFLPEGVDFLEYTTLSEILNLIESGERGSDSIEYSLKKLNGESFLRVREKTSRILQDQKHRSRLLRSKKDICKVIFDFSAENDFEVENGPFSTDFIFHDCKDFYEAQGSYQQELRGFSSIKNSFLVTVCCGFNESPDNLVGIYKHEKQHVKFYYSQGNTHFDYNTGIDNLSPEKIHKIINICLKIALHKIKDEILAREVFGGHEGMNESYSSLDGKYFFCRPVFDYLLEYGRKLQKNYITNVSTYCFYQYISPELKRISQNMESIVKENSEQLDILMQLPVEHWHIFDKTGTYKGSDFFPSVIDLETIKEFFPKISLRK